MSARSPHWERPDWLPEFEVISWPRLSELQAEHRRLFAAQRSASGALSAVKARFAAEDQGALERERQVARSGKPVSTEVDGLTPSLRRQAQLEVATQDYAAARDDLLAHVELEIRESLDGQEFVESELKAVAERETPPVMDPHATPDEVSDLAGPSPARRTGGISPGRRALERDIRTAQTWFLTTLSADGDNVRQEVAAARGDQASGTLATVGGVR